MRSVSRILYANMVDMGGIPVRQPLPTGKVDQIDPFLLFHHHTTKVNAESDPKSTGIGPHPHRGFSPVTFIFQGDVHHRDSRGNSSIVKAGGVQWTDVGMGIVHSERPSAKLAKEGGTQEIIQVWINTPAKHKMDQPYYLPLQRNELSPLPLEGGEGYVSVIAGDHKNKTGQVKPKLPLTILMGEAKASAKHTFEVDEYMSAMLYLLDGEINLKGHGLVEGLNLVVFEKEKGDIEIEAKKDTRFLLLAGEPIDEPVATYGPFVMTNQTEIMETMRDYQMGKLGVLIEEFD